MKMPYFYDKIAARKHKRKCLVETEKTAIYIPYIYAIRQAWQVKTVTEQKIEL